MLKIAFPERLFPCRYDVIIFRQINTVQLVYREQLWCPWEREQQKK